MIRNYFKFIFFLHGLFVVNVTSEKTLTELIRMTTSDMIREEGYPVEEHIVTTEDGYILTIHRIPGKIDAPAILLQHGLFSSSFDWIIMGKNKSLAFILADRGYDVWIGNARGNTYSRRHVILDPSNRRFWDFSFHEMGIYDLPAVITYITDMKNDSLFYLGHSMGTTMSYIMVTERPDIAAKVKVLLGFAPAAFIKYWASPARILIDTDFDLENFMNRLDVHELLPQSFFTRIIQKYYCNSLSENNICIQLLFIIFGKNVSQFNFNMLPRLLSHSPAGTSLKTVMHYYQLAKSKKFQHYDYKSIGNTIKYNRSDPPEYNLTNVQVPVALFWSDNDLVIHPKDVKILYDSIPQKLLSYRVSDPKFTHLDFVWAKNAPEVLYPKVLSVLQDYLRNSKISDT